MVCALVVTRGTKGGADVLGEVLEGVRGSDMRVYRRPHRQYNYVGQGLCSAWDRNRSCWEINCVDICKLPVDYICKW